MLLSLIGKGIHAIALIQRANIQHTIQNNQDVLMVSIYIVYLTLLLHTFNN